MNLKELREYIGNVIDYEPTGNTEYERQLNEIINEQYRRLFSEKPFTFAQKEVKLKCFTDISRVVSGGYSSVNQLSILNATTAVPTWIEGNIVAIDGTEYEVLFVDPTTNTQFYVKEDVGTLTAETVTFKHRFIRLPHDVISLLQVGRRSYTIAPTDVGRFIPMTRFEDEYYNLPLDEVNIPNYWVIQDSIRLKAPNLAPEVAAVSTSAGQGQRDVSVAFTWVKYAADEDTIPLESGLSPFSDPVSLSDTEELRIVGMPTYVPFGFYKRYYVHDEAQPAHFASVVQIAEFNPNTGGNQDITFTESDIQSMYFNLENNRYNYCEGYLQRLRLYPRQSEDFELSCRYIYKPEPLQEETDTPDLPVSHHLILAYGALIDILNKHDNTQLSLVYQQKYDQEIIKLEQRFLTQQPRRFVKGFMQSSGVDTLPMFTPLKRLP